MGNIYLFLKHNAFDMPVDGHKCREYRGKDREGSGILSTARELMNQQLARRRDFVIEKFFLPLQLLGEKFHFVEYGSSMLGLGLFLLLNPFRH